ncbi:hypothetical protein BCR42DRAFT_433070 [Absidia repens]|uniref:Uncharacterized protein n=1 Tax=Absidia repens TaxID=90262 RepID=A0A1X2IWI0_9FUNG|nr:hypothetical protein BCR42DRAFT_433070 [Absidia repens]
MDERTSNQIKHYLKKLQYSEDATDREKRYLTLHYYNKRYTHISVLTFILVLTFYLTLHYFEIEILSYLNTEQQTTNETKNHKSISQDALRLEDSLLLAPRMSRIGLSPNPTTISTTTTHQQQQHHHQRQQHHQRYRQPHCCGHF